MLIYLFRLFCTHIVMNSNVRADNDSVIVIVIPAREVLQLQSQSTDVDDVM